MKEEKEDILAGDGLSFLVNGVSTSIRDNL